MNNVNLAKTAEVLCTLGKHLALYGAETRLIVQSVKEMAADLGLLKIDLALTRTGITVKIIKGQAKVIEFAEITSFGINMSALTSLHQICLEVKEGKLKDPEEILLAINAVKAGSYDKSLLILIEAVAASAFAFLNGGNLAIMAATFCGGLLLMFIRFFLLKRGFFECFAFTVSAFCGSSFTLLVAKCLLHLPTPEISIAVMATTLLLVPGFPFMNGFLDVFKGYMDVGISRLINASVLIMAAAIGLIGTVYLVYSPLWEQL